MLLFFLGNIYGGKLLVSETHVLQNNNNNVNRSSFHDFRFTTSVVLVSPETDNAHIKDEVG